MYRISEKDGGEIIARLTEVLKLIPLQDVDAMIAAAQERITRQPEQMLRAIGGTGDPYGYVRYWIKHARRLVEEKAFEELDLTLLHEHNHGHSGWVDIVRRVYQSPRNDVERGLSMQIWDIYVEAARSIFSNEKLSSSMRNVVQCCINRLGKNIPADLVAKSS